MNSQIQCSESNRSLVKYRPPFNINLSVKVGSPFRYMFHLNNQPIIAFKSFLKNTGAENKNRSK